MIGRFLGLFVVGGIVLTIFDGFHTHSGTTAYAHPVLWLAAWWAPLLFGASASIGGLIYATTWRALGGPSRIDSDGRLGAAFVLFALAWFASGFAPLTNPIKLVALIACAVVLWVAVDRTWQGVVLAIGAAVGGCAVEIVLTHLGTFQHLHADLLGIPVWLPGLYLCAGPAVGQIARRVYTTGPLTP